MIQRAEIKVKAGDGGNGVISFRREKFIPFGGPDGGNGGKGGWVFIVANNNLDTLREFQYRRYFAAGDGENGAGKGKHGRGGEDKILLVLPGTLVWKKEGENNVLLADLKQEGQKVKVVRGGKGGYGNAHFVTSTYQAPRLAQRGEVGEEVELLLELKLIADVAIIGYPSSGKSTLLAAVSAAKPQIAPYPFTTREPVLGVVKVGWERFILVEIPGLIEGAHLGRGLGYHLLQHSERTYLFIHLVDGSSRHPVEDWSKVNQELASYSPALGKKPQIVAVNKIDLPEVQARLPELKKEFSRLGIPAFFISAAEGQGVKELMAAAVEMLKEVQQAREPVVSVEKVLRPQPREQAEIYWDGSFFVVKSTRLEKLLATLDGDNSEAQAYRRRQMHKWGINKALGQAGAKAGDKVRVGEKEWEFVP